MIGGMRRREELGRDASAGGVGPAPVAQGDGSFAATMATTRGEANNSPAGTDIWQRTMDLARLGGGSVRITLKMGSGEPVELRVLVRSSMVTVLARVGDRASESAVRDAQDRIERSLAEAGLRLQRFHVHRTHESKSGDASRGERSRRSAWRRRPGEEKQR